MAHIKNMKMINPYQNVNENKITIKMIKKRSLFCSYLSTFVVPYNFLCLLFINFIQIRVFEKVYQTNII